VGTVPIIDFYDKTWYTNKPMLTITDSYWEDRGIKNKTITPGTGGQNSDYGTKSQTTSLIGGSDLNLDDMGSNIKYFYRWNVDASVHECFVDQNGNPGWGDMIVILQDPFLAQDYTAQLCRSSYPTGKFDLNAYTGLSVTWSGNFGNTTTGTEIEPSKMMQNTYKYKYEVSGDCAEGKGVFYIKITDNIKTPKSKTVKYCLDKLPSQINLNDVLGVAVSGLEWEIVSGTSSVGLNTTGILDVTAYIAAEGKVPVKLVYQTKAAACVAAGTTVTLDFTSTL
jgi:hypothetical protein